jgi:hypothetical protein
MLGYERTAHMRLYLEERITELEQTVAALTKRVAALETVSFGGDLVVGDEIEEMETGDRAKVTRIDGDKIYARWGGYPNEMFVRRGECRKVVK